MIVFYLRMMAGIIGILFFYGVAIVPLIVLRPHLEGEQFFIGLLVWASLALLFLPAFLSFVIRYSWFFYGKGEPVVHDLLIALLLEINDHQGPVKVIKNRKGLLFTWNHQDADWSAAMGRQEIAKVYELQIRFDNHRKIVTLNDQFKKTSWDPTLTKIKVGWFSRPQLLLKVDPEPAEGIVSMASTKPTDYIFDSAKLKSAVMNHIRDNGWNVRFSLF